MTERDKRMQADRGPRRTGQPGDAERLRVSRRRVLVAGGAVLLTTTTAAIASEHGGQQRAARAAGKPSEPPAVRESLPTEIPASPRHRAARHRAARHEQPKLPYGQPMYDIDDGPKTVALTIDDGPSPVYTPQVLQILHRYGITASFSMVGRNAAAYPGVAREVAAAGHMIVNHTWNHYDLARMTAVAVQDEIARAADAIHAATGQRPEMFRAPYGFWSPAVFRYCAQARLTPLAWSVDPRDWARPGVSAIVRTILKKTRTGSIILEHDGGGNRAETVAALKIWLPRLLDAGYTFTTP